MKTANDFMLNVAPPAAKTPPANAPREDADSFGNYLREATDTKTVNEKTSANEKPAKEQLIVTTAGKDQNSAATEDHEAIPNEQLVTLPEEEATDAIEEAVTDEVILSVAAAANVEAEIAIEVPVVVEPAKSSVEIVNPTLTPNEEPSFNEPAGAQAPLDIVEATENSTTYSKDKIKIDEKLNFIESNLADAELVEMAKNSALTPVVEAPKPVAAPKPATSILPDATTDSESKEETSDASKNKSAPVEAEAVEAVAKVVEADDEVLEAVAKIVETAPVTPDSQVHETTAEASAPAPPTPVNGLQNQSASVPPQLSHAEAPAAHGEGESPMPTVDRARFVQRVANAFRSAQQNDGQIQMRLSPPELGSLKIEIAVRNGVLSANLEAETPDARRVLLDNLPALRQRLAEQDIRIEKFEVDIRQDGRQQQGQAEAQQQQAEQQSQNAAARNRIRTSPASEVIAAPRILLGTPAVATTDSGLDVRV